MNVGCPECRSIFRIDPAKLPGVAVRARCTVCGGVIAIAAVGSAREDFMTPTSSAPAPATPSTVPAASPPASAATTPARSATPPAPPPFAPRPAAPLGTTPSRGAAPGAQRPFFRPGPTPASPASARPAAQPPARAVPAAASPPVAGAPAPQDPTPAVPQRPAVAPPAPFVHATGTPAPAAPPTPPAGAPAAAGAPRRPLNPFLNADPNARAKRLARALVSDIVTYYPDRQKAGLRDGNLPELFAEEIQKSQQEYADQVGREFAESTPHFREALNEILAQGRPLF